MAQESQKFVGRYLSRFVESLQRSGVSRAVICPGSRSTPLAMALHRAPELQTCILMDERSAAFFALGQAKASGRPVLLVSTSGTAAANFMPAVVEAYWSHVPLIVLTADRPPELRDSGAPQTIDQVRLYGTHVKWFQDMPLADGAEMLDTFAAITAERAAVTASQDPAGPVHLNFPFREPLLTEFPEPSANRSAVPARIVPAAACPSPGAVRDIVRRLKNFPKGFIVAGPGQMATVQPALLALSDRLGWPVWADPLSNIRGTDSAILGTHDLILRAHAETLPQPQAVMRLGAPPTSKALNQFIQHSRAFIIDGEGSYREPNLQPAEMICGQPDLVVGQIVQELSGPTPDPVWRSFWKNQDQAARDRLHDRIETLQEPVEPYLYYHLAEWLKPLGGADVFVSNSMPVRDLDTFTLDPGPALRFWANRGANGIDGIVSTALGVAAVKEQVVLITGDLAFYHDMNGLFAAKKYGLNALIVVINNDGGGIFSFLPQNRLDSAQFEDLFGTPHGLTFEHAAAMYHAEYRLARSLPDLEEAISELARIPGLRIVEWHTLPRPRNVSEHTRLWGD